MVPRKKQEINMKIDRGGWNVGKGTQGSLKWEREKAQGLRQIRETSWKGIKRNNSFKTVDRTCF